MVFGMATQKVTVTLPSEQIQEIRQLVDRGAARSVSGFVQRAVRRALEGGTAWDEELARSLEETGGPLTDEERAWADEMLGHTAPTSPSVAS
jgi:Arc/MetJ-type ribon-helix-helix transcriptional regulator